MNHFMWEKEIDIIVLIEEINIFKGIINEMGGSYYEICQD